MNIANIDEVEDWFAVMQTTERCQTAMMTLQPGKATGDKAEAHEKSDQVLLVLDGKLIGEVGEQHLSLKQGDVLVIPAGRKHRFVNREATPAVAFNVYSPPAYPPGQKG